jgi:hypothetical protein
VLDEEEAVLRPLHGRSARRRIFGRKRTFGRVPRARLRPGSMHVPRQRRRRAQRSRLSGSSESPCGQGWKECQECVSYAVYDQQKPHKMPRITSSQARFVTRHDVLRARAELVGAQDAQDI